MTNEEMLALAEKRGFCAGLLFTEELPFNADFRKYCEENRCGHYGENHSCPPGCGTPDEMRQRLLRYRTALVLKTERPIGSYRDTAAIRQGKADHNARSRLLADELFAAGDRIYAGASCCDLCGECAPKVCPFPERRFSCLSAYCLDVAELAARCGMSFSWDEHRLCLYSMIVF